MVQLELGHDPEEARRVALEAERVATVTAIDHAGRNAPDEWTVAARAAITQVAHDLPTFIADDIWNVGLPEPPEARAIGNIIRWARAEGLIAPTDQFIPSARPGCHQVPRRVWRSLIHEATT